MGGGELGSVWERGRVWETGGEAGRQGDAGVLVSHQLLRQKAAVCWFVSGGLGSGEVTPRHARSIHIVCVKQKDKCDVMSRLNAN